MPLTHLDVAVRVVCDLKAIHFSGEICLHSQMINLTETK